jgi:hypothetical protein
VEEMNHEPYDRQCEQDVSATTGEVKNTPDKHPTNQKDHEQKEKNETHLLPALTAFVRAP